MATLTLRLDEFGWDAVTAVADEHGLTVGDLVAASCRRAPPGAAGVPPRFIPAATGTARLVEVDLDARELEALQRHARTSEVDVEALVRHHVITLLAEIDAGRVGAELAGERAARDDEAA